MGIYLGHISALEYWRSNRRPLPLGASTLDRATPLVPAASVGLQTSYAQAAAPSAQEIEDLSLRGIAPHLSEPVHALLPSSRHVHKLKAASCHICSPKGLPAGAFVDIGGGNAVASPELTLLLLAQTHSPASLLKVAFEFCGSHVPAFGSWATQYKLHALTNAERIASFLGNTSRHRGMHALDSVLPYLLDGSASPRETAIALLLCLPEHLGGYGICLPKLNHRVNMPSKARKASSGSFYVLDLYWPQYAFAIEYDSDEFHEIRPSITHDAAKRNALSYMGITVATVTNEQVKSWDAFDKVAHLVAKATEKRIRSRAQRYNLYDRREALRRELL